MDRKNLFKSLACMAAVVAVGGIATVDFLTVRTPEPVARGPGVTEVKRLSDWFSDLKGGPGDTDVFVLDSGKPGASMVILGGTHSTESAGLVSAVLFVENAVVKEGKVFVIPHANESGFTWTEPGQGHPQYFRIRTAGGERSFRYGARGTNPVHQWPDPDMYKHYPSGQVLAADEIRNLNRCFPGKADGLLTQKVAFAITELVRKEKAALFFDQHEAPPEKPLVDAICVHERALELASMVSMELEMQGLPMRVEASPRGLHGFSHRELGDFTEALVILSETSNPVQGSVRGRTTPELCLTGDDAMYEYLLKSGKLHVKYIEGGEKLEHRVGRNVANICQFALTWTDFYPELPIVIEGMPTYEELGTKGIGAYLLPVPATI